MNKTIELRVKRRDERKPWAVSVKTCWTKNQATQKLKL